MTRSSQKRMARSRVARLRQLRKSSTVPASICTTSSVCCLPAAFNNEGRARSTRLNRSVLARPTPLLNHAPGRLNALREIAERSPQCCVHLDLLLISIAQLFQRINVFGQCLRSDLQRPEVRQFADCRLANNRSALANSVRGKLRVLLDLQTIMVDGANQILKRIDVIVRLGPGGCCATLWPAHAFWNDRNP
jgi:hypothetical protein